METLKKFWNKLKTSKTSRNLLINSIVLLIIVLLTIIFTLDYARKSDIETLATVNTTEEIEAQPEPTVTVEYISAFLVKSSELTTGKLKTRGYLDYKSGKGIPFLTKNAFGMLYEAEIRAGIRLEEIKVIGVNHDNKTAYVSLPKAEILGTNVDPNSISYIDEKFTLIPLDPKEDANKAQSYAEKDAKEYAKITGILEFADDHAQTLVRNLCEGMIEDYQIEFVAPDFVLPVTEVEEKEESEITEPAQKQ